MKIIDAAKVGDLISLKKLIAEGSNTSATDENGYTALHWACANNFPDVILYLLNHNTSRNHFLGVGNMSIQLSFNHPTKETDLAVTPSFFLAFFTFGFAGCVP
jgi:ankyrin repeat protein